MQLVLNSFIQGQQQISTAILVKNYEQNSSRLGSRISTIEICTWTVIGFISSVKIISKPQELKDSTESLLQLHFYVGELVSVSFDIKGNTTEPYQ